MKGKLSNRCRHVKHQGGVKNSIQLLARVIPESSYATRFDVARYYESTDHDVLLLKLQLMQVSEGSQDIVQQYFSLTDRRGVGCCMIAGMSPS